MTDKKTVKKNDKKNVQKTVTAIPAGGMYDRLKAKK